MSSELMSAPLLVITLLVLGVCSTPYTDCGSELATVTNVDVSGCPDTEDVCTLALGTQKTINIQFRSQSDSGTVTAVAQAIVDGGTASFQLTQSDGCESGLSCPLERGVDYTYTHNIYVKSMYLLVPVTVRWALLDENNNYIVCVNIECQISAS